jgi:hypothetical protein
MPQPEVAEIVRKFETSLPSPALQAVQGSCCWAFPLSPLLFYAPELCNDLLSNHWRGKSLDHAGSCCPACHLSIIAALVFCMPWATSQPKQVEIIATGMCNE